ncbi:MAG TPA: acetamidase/formamidase family protein [Chloroflexota bacterium]
MKSLSRDQATYAYSRFDRPVLEVSPGETIRVETEDALGATFRAPEDIAPEGFARLTYPLTGPIHVRGAEPGDTLAVRVDDIELSDQGVVLYRGGGGVLKDWMSGHAGRIVAIKDGYVHFDQAIKIPVRPMIGKIGTAPALEVIRTSTPGVHGGNMDCPELTVGSTIYLPVEVAGGLLAVGDVHAAMGDCEVCGTGVETRARLTLTIDLRKGRPAAMTWPRVETADAIMTLAAARPLDEALYLAVKDMVLWLEEEYGFERADAYLLLSLAGHARPGNWFTGYCLLPRAYLPRK